MYFFDATFSVPKSVSLLHASLQVRAQQSGEAGQDDEAGRWTALAQTVWDGIMAGKPGACGVDRLQLGVCLHAVHLLPVHGDPPGAWPRRSASLTPILARIWIICTRGVASGATRSGPSCR